MNRRASRKQPNVVTFDQIRADILAVEKEAEGLLDELLKGGAK